MDAKPLRMLVALDGSPAAESILAAIMPLVRITRIDLTLFRAVDHSDEIPDARAHLARTEAALALHRVRAESRVERGEPAASILRHLKGGGYDFAALTTHGRRGLSRLLAGSVTEEVVRSAEVPLIVNRPDARIGDWKRIVVPLDGSSEAETVLEDVGILARATGAELHLLNVGHVLLTVPGMEFGYSSVSVPDLKPYLDTVRQRLIRKGLSVNIETRLGNPAHEIVSLAGDIGAGLIALATHGRSGMSRVIMGSVAEEVFRTAPCPILVQPVARLSGALRRMELENPAAR